MQKAIDFLEDQLHGITKLGATPSLVETVKVHAYGQSTPLKHLASTQCAKQRVTIHPFDPNLTATIAKACQTAGFDAYVFSKDAVVVTLPMMSGETKEEIRQRIKKLGDDTKIAIRNIRKQFRNGQPKEENHDKEIQEATDRAIEIIDGIIETKSSYVR